MAGFRMICVTESSYTCTRICVAFHTWNNASKWLLYIYGAVIRIVGRHGTRCAGVISMVGNNNYCGVGIAPHSKIGGVRMLDGEVSDVVESRSVSFNVKNIDIMSASWGPSDNGRMVDGPGKLGVAAFEKGITEVRLSWGGSETALMEPLKSGKDWKQTVSKQFDLSWTQCSQHADQNDIKHVC